jgi:hypothetical protein
MVLRSQIEIQLVSLQISFQKDSLIVLENFRSGFMENLHCHYHWEQRYQEHCDLYIVDYVSNEISKGLGLLLFSILNSMEFILLKELGEVVFQKLFSLKGELAFHCFLEIPFLWLISSISDYQKGKLVG